MHTPRQRRIGRVTEADLAHVEESRRQIEECLRVLRLPYWPDYRVPSTIESCSMRPGQSRRAKPRSRVEPVMLGTVAHNKKPRAEARG
jgi:hypothetical protein